MSTGCLQYIKRERGTARNRIETARNERQRESGRRGKRETTQMPCREVQIGNCFRAALLLITPPDRKESPTHTHTHRTNDNNNNVTAALSSVPTYPSPSPCWTLCLVRLSLAPSLSDCHLCAARHRKIYVDSLHKVIRTISHLFIFVSIHRSLRHVNYGKISTYYK